MQRDDIAGDEFDGWMSGAPAAGAARAAAPDPSRAPEASGEAVGKKSNLRSKLLKPGVLIPCVLGLAVGALVLARGGSAEAPVVADQYSQVLPLDPSVLPTVDTREQPVPGTVAPEAAQSQPGDSIAAGAAAGSAPTVIAAQASLPPQTTAQAALATAPVEAVAATPAAPAQSEAPAPKAAQAAPADPQAELARRVAALEGDLDRAQQTRRADRQRIQRLERELAAAKAKAADLTVVAVLSDGVVVRSGAGSERVYAVGSRIAE